MRQKGAANKEWGKLAECGILEVMTQLFQDQFIEQPIPFPTDLKFCFYHVKKKCLLPIFTQVYLQNLALYLSILP